MSQFIGSFAPGENFTTTLTTFEPDNPEIPKAATAIAWDVLIDGTSVDTGVIGDAEFSNPSTGIYHFTWAIPGGTANGTHMMVRFTVSVDASGATSRTAMVVHHANIQPDFTELLTGANVQTLIFEYLIEGVQFQTVLKRMAALLLGQTSGPDAGVAGTFTAAAMGAPGTPRISAPVDDQGFRTGTITFTD